MNFHVLNISGFERFNVVLCTATLDGNITQEEQTWLNAQVERFNKTNPGGPLKTRYFLEFSHDQIIFRQFSVTEAPTRQNFNRLLQELGLALTDDTVSARTMPPAQSAQATVRIGAK